MKKAFSLAEVLITLAVVGIVAALTLPTVIQNHKNNELQTRFKKSYSTLSQLIQRIVAEEYGGTVPAPTSEADVKTFENYIDKYALKSSSCHRDAICDTNIFPNRVVDGHTLPSTYNKGIVNISLFDDGTVAFNDESIIYFDWGNGTGYFYFTIDTNGWKRQPNHGGIDVFTFKMLSNGKLVSVTTKSDCITNPNNYCVDAALSDPNYFKKVKK